MASNEPVPIKGPLSMMQQLSPATYYYEPSGTVVSDPKSPKLIAMFSWMGAKDVHIAKYINQHAAMFPTARILLVKCPFGHTVSSFKGAREIAPAIPVFRAIADTIPESAKEPQILIHAFSNGGAVNMTMFEEMLTEATRSKTIRMPPHVTIFDSCPGYPNYGLTYRALASVLPWILRPLAHALLSLYILQDVLSPRKPPIVRMNTWVDQPALLPAEARRTYIYSKEDDMILWTDVEKHAAVAEDVGFNVRKEEFIGSGHVAHARLDMERYWQIVQETWDGTKA